MKGLVSARYGAALLAFAVAASAAAQERAAEGGSRAASASVLARWSAAMSRHDVRRHRGAERFTVDFGMPRGSAVHAARGGTVVLVEDSHVMGCELDECSRFANFVVVLHDDGTTGEYFHLEPHTAAVRPGERVRRGQLLARSGNTGFSTAPHLHLGVYRTDAEGRTESLAVRFSTRSGTVTVPRSGARYLHSLDR
jgi:murein DD-endopeptidase MepM/ murein hydrolase activator NlpD